MVVQTRRTLEIKDVMVFVHCCRDGLRGQPAACARDGQQRAWVCAAQWEGIGGMIWNRRTCSRGREGHAAAPPCGRPTDVARSRLAVNYSVRNAGLRNWQQKG